MLAFSSTLLQIGVNHRQYHFIVFVLTQEMGFKRTKKVFVRVFDEFLLKNNVYQTISLISAGCLLGMITTAFY